MRNTALLYLILFFNSICFSQPGSRDYTFQPEDDGIYGNGLGFDNWVWCTAPRADGKIWVGGNFTSYNGFPRSRIALLNADGSLKTDSVPQANFNNNVRCLALQPDGKILVGGTFTNSGNQVANRLCRLNPSGSIDESFQIGLGFNDVVMTLVVQEDGKILAGGHFTTYNGEAVNRIARLNQNGTLDTTFNTGSAFDDVVWKILQEPNGNLLVGGFFTEYNGVECNRMVRLHQDGTLDSGFSKSIGFNNVVLSLAFQPNGKIMVGGDFTHFDSIVVNKIVRLNQDGTLDSSFKNTASFDRWIYTIDIQTDGKILAGGNYTKNDTILSNRLVRFLENGKIDSSFNTGMGFDGAVSSLILLENGDLVITGFFNSFEEREKGKIVRLDQNGLIDSTFASISGFNSGIWCTSVLENDQILVGGNFTYYKNTKLNRFARLTPDGEVDATFKTGNGFNDGVTVIMVQKDRKILVGGFFTFYDGILRNRIVRLNRDGTIDQSFQYQGGFNDGRVHCISIQKDGKILIGGDFYQYNGVHRNNLVRLNTDGSLDLSFTHRFGFDKPVRSIAIQKDGKILVGGDFVNFDGKMNKHLVRLNPDGTQDQTFNIGTGFNQSVHSVVIQNDDLILVGGEFTAVDNQNAHRIVRLKTDGSLDPAFNTKTQANNTIRTIALQVDGKIIIGGDFTQFDGATKGGMVRLLSNGAVDNSFVVAQGFDGTVHGFSFQKDRKIIVNGFFSAYENDAKNHLIRLFNDDATLSTKEKPLADYTREIFLYPNPTQNKIYIHLNEVFASVQLSILDLQGRVLETIHFDHISEIEYDLKVNAGVYLVCIETEKFREVVKIVKNN